MAHIGTAASWRVLLDRADDITTNVDACLRDYATLEDAYTALLATLADVSKGTVTLHPAPAREKEYSCGSDISVHSFT